MRVWAFQVSAPTGSFIMVSAAHVQQLGPTAALLYTRICWRTERCPDGWRATRAMLAEETGLTLEMVRTAGRVLRELGMVTTTRASASDATLVWRPVSAGHPDSGDSPISEMGDLATPCGGSDHLPEMGDLAISSYETDKTTTDSLAQPSDEPPAESFDEQGSLPILTVVGAAVATTTADPIEEEFTRFWELYPRRVGRKKALSAYRAARKAVSVEEIAQGLVAQLPDLRRREVSYVPHPATWLNQGRWADDPRSSAQASGRRNYEAEWAEARAAGHDIQASSDPTVQLVMSLLSGGRA
jgi:hypothetical protein